jgi:hypothetical protein
MASYLLLPCPFPGGHLHTHTHTHTLTRAHIRTHTLKAAAPLPTWTSSVLWFCQSFQDFASFTEHYGTSAHFGNDSPDCELSLAVRVFEHPAKRALGWIPISKALSLEKRSSSSCSSTDSRSTGDQWTVSTGFTKREHLHVHTFGLSTFCKNTYMTSQCYLFHYNSVLTDAQRIQKTKGLYVYLCGKRSYAEYSPAELVWSQCAKHYWYGMF